MIITSSYIEEKNSNNDIIIINNNVENNILFIGSCRMVAFINYFYNDERFKNKYNYLCVMVHKTVELSKTLDTNEYIKSLINKSKILICEYMVNFNYFNTARNRDLNIFKIYDNFELVISLPNFDVFLYTKDIIRVDKYCNDNFILYLNDNINIEILTNILKIYRNNQINKYCKIIEKSSLSELKEFILNNYLNFRLEHTSNHPTNLLLYEMYKLILHKFFKMEPSQITFEINNAYEFLPSTNYNTILTIYDKVCLNYEINENYIDKELADKYLLNN
jgi:hypothetical protein